MTYDEMIKRIVAFRLGHGDGRYLREVDPQCADAVHAYWEQFGPFGLKPCKTCIDDLFRQVEKGIAEAKA